MAVVLELLRGEDLESLSRKYAVTAATLSAWRDAFLASGEAGLKIREEDLVDENGQRMKSVIAELAMANELVRAPPATGECPPFFEVEVEAMSQAQSPSTGRKYGRARVLAVWGRPRSTFYARQQRARQPVAPQRRGPKTKYTDTELVERIRAILAASPSMARGIARSGRGCASRTFALPNPACCA